VDRQNVNLIRRVPTLAPAAPSVNAIKRLHFIPARMHHRSRLKLHPPQPPARIHNKVVAFAVAQGLATRNPMLVAFKRNAASESSPVRFGFVRRRKPATFSTTPVNSAKTIDSVIMRFNNHPIPY
jgi:hypothetical protein